MKTVNKFINLENGLKFETKSGNKYVFCPETCLVLKESELPSEKHVLKASNDRDRMLSEKYNVLGKPEYSTGREQVTEKEIKKHLMQYGFNELIIEATTACNLRCKYCIYSENYKEQRDHSNEMMSIDTAIKAIKTYLELCTQSRIYNPYKKPSIAFFGGEPLMNFALIKECVLYIRDHYKDKVFFTLTTNGTLLTDKMTEFLVAHDFYIIFSVDGPTDIHDRNRVFANGKGTFQNAMENIERFVKVSKKPVFVNNVYDYETDLVAVSDFFANHPYMINLSVSPVNPYNTSYYKRFDLECLNQFIDQEKMLKRMFIKQLQDSRLNPKKSLSFLSVYAGKPALSAMMRPILKGQFHKIIDHTGACIPGEKIMAGIDGTLYPCEKISQSARIGHVDTGLDFENIMTLVNGFNEQIVKTCTECPIRNVCGHCYISFLKNGKFSKDQDLCRTAITSFTNNLSYAYSILEEDPSWFEEFSTKYYEGLREMAVRLK